MNEIITHAIAAGFPFLAYLAFQHYRTRRDATSFLGDDLPAPKKAPSDWVIYRYDTDGNVVMRHVFHREEDALEQVGLEKRRGLTGRLFKDGEVLDTWNTQHIRR